MLNLFYLWVSFICPISHFHAYILLQTAGKYLTLRLKYWNDNIPCRKMLLLRTIIVLNISTGQFVLTLSQIRKGTLSAPCSSKYLFLHILLMNTHLSSVLVCSADLVDRGPSHSSLHWVQAAGALLAVLLLGGPGEGPAKVTRTGVWEVK